MTMSREAKKTHHLELRIAQQNSGYVTAEWQRPTERRDRIAELGHAMMTAAEYRGHRMGRRTSGTASRREVAIAKIRARRVGHR